MARETAISRTLLLIRMGRGRGGKLVAAARRFSLEVGTVCLLRVALAQMNVTLGDFRGNLDKIIRWIDRAKSEGADLVCLPELCICGYPPEDLLLRKSFLDDNRIALDLLAPQCAGATVLVGFADSVEGGAANAAALIHDGRLIDVYHKVELPNYGVFDEKRYFKSGDRRLMVELDNRRFSVNVCEDIWIPGSLTETFAIHGRAHVTINLAASPFHAGKEQAVRLGILDRFARATGTLVMSVNMVGGQDELIFDGGSLVVAPGGAVRARARSFEEELLLVDLEGEDWPDTLNQTDFVPPSDGFHRLAPLGPRDKTRRPDSVAPLLDRQDEILGALVLGVKDYVTKNGFKKVVIGLSGGIDSALTAAIAVKALGAENVVGVTMPSQYTSDETFSDARVLARNLGIELITAPIGKIFETYLDSLKSPCGEEDLGLTAENLQARIRGNILMALSNRFGWLVLTTGNKSEVAVGYSTLYGDAAGGFAVIKDVPKTVVYELSERINRQEGRELIPQSIIDRAPSAELRPDQKDEDSLPPYPILDRILEAYVEQDRSPADIVTDGFDPETVAEVARMVDRNEYKRRQAPPGIKITPKAFGKDRRLPITNRYSGEAIKGDIR